MDKFLEGLASTCQIILAIFFAVFMVLAIAQIHNSMLRIEAAMWRIGCQSQGLTPAMCEFLRKEAVK